MRFYWLLVASIIFIIPFASAGIVNVEDSEVIEETSVLNESINVSDILVEDDSLVTASSGYMVVVEESIVEETFDEVIVSSERIIKNQEIIEVENEDANYEESSSFFQKISSEEKIVEKTEGGFLSKILIWFGL